MGKYIIVGSSYFSRGRKLLSQMDVNEVGSAVEWMLNLSGKENVLVAKLLIGCALPLVNGRLLGQGTSGDVKAAVLLLFEWLDRKWLKISSALAFTPYSSLTFMPRAKGGDTGNTWCDWNLGNTGWKMY